MSKPQPILLDMPEHVQQLIVDSMNLKTKLSLRICSKLFKTLVAASFHNWKLVSFSWSSRQRCIKVIHEMGTGEENIAKFYGQRHDYIIRYPRRTKDRRVVERGNYVDAAVDHFLKIFKTPKRFIDRLEVKIEDEWNIRPCALTRKENILRTMNAYLLSLNRRIHVKLFEMVTDPNQDDVLHILPHLVPGYLESIVLNKRTVKPSHVTTMNLNKVWETKQYQRAQGLFLGQYYRSLPNEKTSHLAMLSGYVPQLDRQEFRNIVDKILNNEWDWRRIYCRVLDPAIMSQCNSQYEKIPSASAEEFRVKRGSMECRVRINDCLYPMDMDSNYKEVTIFNWRKYEA